MLAVNNGHCGPCGARPYNLVLTSECEYTQHAPAWPRDNSTSGLDAPGGLRRLTWPINPQPNQISSTTPEFPDKMRVHALAKLLGVTSKQVLAEAAALGTEIAPARSRVSTVTSLSGFMPRWLPRAEAIEPVVAELDTLIDPVVEAPVVEEPAAEAPVEAPVAEAPAEKPVRARRTRKKVVVEEPAAEEAVDPAVAEISAGLDAAAALQSKEAEQSDLFTSFEAPQTHQPEVAPAAPQVPLFLQPDLEAAEVAPRRRRARREPAAAPAVVEEKQTTAEAETVVSRGQRRLQFLPVEEPAVDRTANRGRERRVRGRGRRSGRVAVVVDAVDVDVVAVNRVASRVRTKSRTPLPNRSRNLPLRQSRSKPTTLPAKNPVRSPSPPLMRIPRMPTIPISMPTDRAAVAAVVVVARPAPTAPPTRLRRPRTIRRTPSFTSANLATRPASRTRSRASVVRHVWKRSVSVAATVVTPADVAHRS